MGEPSTTPSPLLQVHGVSKRFGQTEALNDVSLTLHGGEVLCIVGENGAGKSTLIKVLSGAIAPDAGSVQVGEAVYESLTPAEAMELGLATIYQEVELIDSLTVAANIFLGQEPTQRIPFLVDARVQNARAREILDTLHIDINERLLVEQLSAAQKQTLQIVKALHQESSILIMDEPTSSLGLEETRALMGLVRRLRERNLGIIYISHHLEEVFEIGDTVMILKDGRHVGTYPCGEVNSDFVVRKMVGRDASAFFSREPAPIGDVAFRADSVTWNGIVRDVSFDVRKGEVFGIGGLVGSGRSELASILYGAARPDTGRIVLGNRELSLRSPADAIEQGVCLVTEDRHVYGMFPERSIQENVAVVHNEFTPCRVVGTRSEAALADSMIDKLRIATFGRGQSIMNLSGGNQQKVMIARWLLDEYRLYIFDEPTKGVDVGAKQEIYALIVDAARNGKCVIMISSDMPELLSMSDRIGVMREGRMVRVFDNDSDLNEQELIRYFMGEEENNGDHEAHTEHQ